VVRAAAEDRVNNPDGWDRSGFWAAVAVCVVFGVAISLGGLSNSTEHCDRPVQSFLLAIGVIATLLALVFGAGVKDESTNTSNTQNVLIFSFIVTGIVGTAYSTTTYDCEPRAPHLMRYVNFAIIAFGGVASLLAISIVGTVGGPVFAILGNLIGWILELLAKLFNGLSAPLVEDDNKDGEWTQPPNETKSKLCGPL